MSKRTPATMALEKAGKRFELLTYEYDPDAPSIGLQAAESLGLAPSVVFKTLMVVAGMSRVSGSFRRIRNSA